jgi:hypothetical protein
MLLGRVLSYNSADLSVNAAGAGRDIDSRRDRRVSSPDAACGRPRLGSYGDSWVGGACG